MDGYGVLHWEALRVWEPYYLRLTSTRGGPDEYYYGLTDAAKDRLKELQDENKNENAPCI